ncbi:hypothetical protein [Streptomyces sp. NPDC001054]
MPTPDPWGQGIQLMANGDAPDMSKAISDLAVGTIPRILYYASASARGATLTGDRAPVAGMLTWLKDVRRLDLYDGTAWVTLTAGTSSWTTIAPASGFQQNGNSNGNLQYRLLTISGEVSIQFRGALGRSSWPATPVNDYIVNATALPTAARPTTLRTFGIPCSDQNSDRIALKCDLQPDGYLRVLGFNSTAKPPWFSFNGSIVSL